MQPEALGRALIIGAFLAVLGVGFFFVMYFLILANAEAAPRLFGSLLLPPVLIGLLVGGYAMLRSGKRKD